MKYILMLFIICSISCARKRTRVISGLEGQPLLNFDVMLMDSATLISTKDIPNGKPIVLFYLNPYCTYCRAQTEELTEKINNLKNINFYLVSSFPLNEIKKYNEHYKLSNFSNITVGKIKDDASFVKYYKISGVPYIAIYNKDKKLNQVMLGKVPISEIKTVASQ